MGRKHQETKWTRVSQGKGKFNNKKGRRGKTLGR